MSVSTGDGWSPFHIVDPSSDICCRLSPVDHCNVSRVSVTGVVPLLVKFHLTLVLPQLFQARSKSGHVATGVNVGVIEGVGVVEGVKVGVTDGVNVGVGVFDGVNVKVGVIVGVGVLEGVGVIVGVAVGAGSM